MERDCEAGFSNMTRSTLIPVLALLGLAVLGLPARTLSAEPETVERSMPPVVSTATGLLLEPALYLTNFSTADFAAASRTIGAERIHKKWTSPVVTLPPHPRQVARGLTESEVKAYMIEVRRLFDKGESVPISDVGLISTQEDVVRKPMLNHIAAFSNSVARVYLLVQRTSTDTGWSYYSIVQDLTLKSPLSYFAELQGIAVKFEGISCYKCHASGPLAIHPARADLISDAPLAVALNQHIADQPVSRFHFPAGETPPDYGKPLGLKFCTKCHEAEGDRSPLFKVHSHPIRILVDFGYMPPKRRLTPSEIAELKSWLDQKP